MPDIKLYNDANIHYSSLVIGGGLLKASYAEHRTLSSAVTEGSSSPSSTGRSPTLEIEWEEPDEARNGQINFRRVSVS